MQNQTLYGIPQPLSHLYTVSRDAVQPKWFTVETLSGKSFRIYSPELAKALDDFEEERFTDIQSEILD